MMDYPNIFRAILLATPEWTAKAETSRLYQILVKSLPCEHEHIFWYGKHNVLGFIDICNCYHKDNDQIRSIYNHLKLNYS